MKKVRVLNVVNGFPFRAMMYCVDCELHVDVVDDHGIAIGTRRVVTECDKTCESKASIKEFEVPDEAVAEMRELLGKGPTSG